MTWRRGSWTKENVVSGGRAPVRGAGTLVRVRLEKHKHIGSERGHRVHLLCQARTVGGGASGVLTT